GVTVDNTAWSLADEVELFRNIDIGVYPLADDDWSRGKCGFKAIEFMACGVPVIGSPIGANVEVINGRCGFMASTAQEWIKRLRSMRDKPGKRAALGAAGRKRVMQYFSLNKK
ncbi:MAG: glycosyltransferase, partial [Sphingobacteriia bacterium]|nr:glycosyltransferase [Candidatus Fonsibacter lacus]